MNFTGLYLLISLWYRPWPSKPSSLGSMISKKTTWHFDSLFAWWGLGCCHARYSIVCVICHGIMRPACGKYAGFYWKESKDNSMQIIFVLIWFIMIRSSSFLEVLLCVYLVGNLRWGRCGWSFQCFINYINTKLPSIPIIAAPAIAPNVIVRAVAATLELEHSLVFSSRENPLSSSHLSH